MFLVASDSLADWTVPRDDASGAPRSPGAASRFWSSNVYAALFARSDDWAPIRGQHGAAAARQNIYRAGEPNDGVLAICDGWAVRFVQLPNGKRQILSVLLPGDLASPAAIVERRFAFSIQAVTDVRYCCFPVAAVDARIRHDPALFDLWLRLIAAEHRAADRRLVDLGQRTALERIAGLVVHIMARFEQRCELLDDEFPFPLSQQQIADCTGLTPVHACRVLSALRKSGICDVGRGTVKILDRTALRRIGSHT